MKRVLMLLIAAVASLLLGAAPAGAAPAGASPSGAAPAGAKPYPPKAATVTTNAGTYVPGSPVIITANGFSECVGGIVTFTITPPGGGTPIVTTAPVNASGVATVTITSGTVIGTYTVVASCGPLSATTSFAVSAAPGIPRTGSSIDGPLRAAAVLMLIGVGFVVVAMRRRRRTTTAIA